MKCNIPEAKRAIEKMLGQSAYKVHLPKLKEALVVLSRLEDTAAYMVTSPKLGTNPGDKGYKEYKKVLEDITKKIANVKVEGDGTLPMREISNSLSAGIAAIGNVKSGRFTPSRNVITLAGTTTTEQVDEAVTAGIRADSNTGERTTEEIRNMLTSKDEIVASVKEILDEAAKGSGDHIALHEFVHAGALQFMHNNKDHVLTNRVNKLYELAMDNRDYLISASAATDVMDDYWTKNVDEFLAEALSNPRLMKALQDVNVNDPEIKGKYLSEGMFKRLLDTVMGMLGMKKTDSLYEYTLDGYMAILEHQEQVSAAEHVKYSTPAGRKRVADLQELIKGNRSYARTKAGKANAEGLSKQDIDIINNIKECKI